MLLPRIHFPGRQQKITKIFLTPPDVLSPGPEILDFKRTIPLLRFLASTRGDNQDPHLTGYERLQTLSDCECSRDLLLALRTMQSEHPCEDVLPRCELHLQQKQDCRRLA